MSKITYNSNPKLQVMKDADIDKLLNQIHIQAYYANQTHVDFQSIQSKDIIIKQLREENNALKEEIEDLKKDLKSFIEMES
jgi:cell division protein FtsB